MASLQGTKIKNTYPGLLKTDDNGVVGAVEKRVTDGQGNATNMTIGTGGASFDSGTVDFTGATVSGLPADVNTTYDLASAQNLTNVDVTLTGSDATVDTVTLAAGTNITLTDNGSNQITIDASGGAAGLESGTGTDSMQSAASLTTVAANAAGTCSIALGDGASAGGTSAITIGAGATSTNGTITIGPGATNPSGLGIAIGTNATTGALGEALAIGLNACATGNAGAMAIGCNAKSLGGLYSMAIGKSAQTFNNVSASIAFGPSSKVCAESSVAIGQSAVANATQAVAIGAAVTAAKACTVTVKELETCIAGGGIYLTTPDGLAQPKLTVNNSSELLIGGNPVGGGGAAGLESGTGTDSMQSASSLTATPASASTDCSIALGFNATTPGVRSVAIGRNALSGPAAVAIGPDSDASDSGVAIGTGANGGSTATAATVAIGQSANTGNNNRAIALGSCTLVSAACGIAIGNETTAGGANSIHIAGNASFSSHAASGSCSIAIGFASNAIAAEAIAIGNGSCSNEKSVAIGCAAVNSGGSIVAIGDQANGGNIAGTAVGACTDSGAGSVAIGRNSQGTGIHAIAIGGQCNVFSTNCTNASSTAAIAIGTGAAATFDRAIAIGENSSSTASQSVALGRGIVAAKACTVTVCQLHTCGVGLGITMTSADTTEEQMTLTDADVLAIGGDTIPANDTATPTTVNRIWSGTSAQYTALGTYDANTLYYVS